MSLPGSAEPSVSTAPLAGITSIKVKLGLLVAVSAAMAAVIATVGAAGGVPAILTIPVTIALALGVTQLLAVGMTSPLRAMTKAARQMAAGDYSGRIVTTSRDEIGDLSAAFNLMARDLAEVDRERRELVANVSHELRTPLTALSARLENMADGVEVADQAGMELALGQTKRLSTLVSDLLDLSRLDAGLTELTVSRVGLADFLAEAVEDLADLQRDVAFTMAVEPPELVVEADLLRLRQLVTNLMANAMRHSPPGGVVHLHAYAVGASDPDTDADPLWRLDISDGGPGIRPADRDRVFERFGTLAGNEGGGTGLGLAIARWVCVLHGGSVRFVDPPGDAASKAGVGARVRVELPQRIVDRSNLRGPEVVAAAAPEQTRVTSRTEVGGVPGLWGGFWPQRAVSTRPDLLVASAAVGLIAALAVPLREIGLGLFLVVLLAGATVLFASPHRRERYTLFSAGFAFVLGLPVLIRDAEWIAILCLLAGALVMTVSVTRATTISGFVLSALAWPLAGLRGLPWVAESINAFGGRSRAAPIIRTLAVSGIAVVIFGVLFASADPVLASWLRTLLPEWSFARLVLRGFVAVAVAAAVLGAAYLALNPPRVDNAAGEAGHSTRYRYEWLAPVLLVNLVFVAFLIAQATVVFGGHDYLRRTTGLTYAQYVHQGFGQLTIATGLTLVVVWATARKAAQTTREDRLWLRASLGLLCVLTLIVVASALYRMQVYQEAYGFTRLRLLVDVFEGWLGFVVLTVLVAGIKLKGSALPRIALFSGAAALAALAFANPDAWIARHNIERYQASERIDWYYLEGLSADALPEIAALPPADLACLQRPVKPAARDLWSWNWGYHRAKGLDLPPRTDNPAYATCLSITIGD